MAIAIPSGMLWRAMPSVTMDASEDGDDGDDVGDDNDDIGGVCSTDDVGLSSIVGDGSRMEGEIISGGGNVDLLGFTFFSKAIALDEIMGLEVEGSNNIVSDVVEAGVIVAILTTDDDDD